MIERVAVVGLGKLGLPVAASLAARGLSVVGADLDARRVDALRAGDCPIFEPGLAEQLAAAAGRFTATTSVADAARQADVAFIVVPTPSLSDGAFSTEYVRAACRDIGRALGDDVGPRIVVVASTVSPGSTDGEIRAALEEASGRRAGMDFGLCYSPEFIALGNVIDDFLRPDLILIGESDEASGSELAEMYGCVCYGDPPVYRMAIINAEIAKIALNTFVTTKIAFANMLSEICERVPGGDVDAITNALGSDERIGNAYLNGGLSYGGPCFPRDNRALAAFARSVGVDPLLPEATDAANHVHRASVADAIYERIKSGSTVAVLGLANKPSTDVVDRAAGVDIAKDLKSRSVNVIAFDPIAATAARSVLGDDVPVIDSLEACVDEADVIVLATAWSDLVEALPGLLASHTRARIVVDCWRSLDATALPAHVDLVRLGTG